LNTSEATFDFHENNPSFWYQKSVSLYASATLVWDARQATNDQEFVSGLGLKEDFSVESGCEHQYLMLFGLSYEIMFKAICITQGIEFQKKNHDLLNVAKLALVVLSEKEKTQLRLLSEFVTWEGRYPVPKKHEKMTQHWNATRKKLWQTEDIFGFEVTSRTDIFEHKTLKALWLKLQSEYWEKRT